MKISSRSSGEGSRWDDGGFGTDGRFYLLQQVVAAEIIGINVEGYF